MENFKNIASTIILSIGTTMSFLDEFEQWSRIGSALITIIVGLITLYRFYKNKR